MVTPSSSFCLLPKEVLWPFRFPWYRTQVTKANEKKKKKESSDGQERPGRRPRFLPESLATEHDCGSPMSPGAASHRGPGTVPVQQTQQASSPHAPAGSAGGEGESSSAPPGYAEFVTSAVRSAMEPVLAERSAGCG